jgi:signal transduction histidine kinase
MLSRSRLVDTGATVLFATLAVVESYDVHIDDGTRLGQAWVNALLGVLLAGSLLVWRTQPLVAYGVMLVVLAVPAVLVPHELFSISGLPPVVLVTWSVARSRDGWPARLAWLPPTLLPILSLSDRHGFVAFGDVLFRLVFIGGAVVVARTMRRIDLQGRQLQETLQALSSEQAAREEAAVAEERTRIAAEMHDVVAHAVSMMIVQVGATRMAGVPESELATLRLAEQTGRQALAELRVTLGLLRGAEHIEEATLRPLPGLGAVDSLVAGVREAGLVVNLERHVVSEVPESAALTTYRILQEALTNALKHGGPGVVDVCLRADVSQIAVRVRSPLGAGTLRLPSGGHGLAGMHERVALFDGTLSVGPREGQYVVEAVLNLDPAAVP